MEIPGTILDTSEEAVRIARAQLDSFYVKSRKKKDQEQEDEEEGISIKEENESNSTIDEENQGKPESEFITVGIKEEPEECEVENYEYQHIPQVFPSISQEIPEVSIKEIDIKEEIKEEPEEIHQNKIFTIKEFSLKNLKKISKCIVCRNLMLKGSSDFEVCENCSDFNPVVALTRLTRTDLKIWQERRRKNEKLCKTKAIKAIKVPFWCDLCGKKLSNKNYLSSHFDKVHAQPMEMTCEICGKTSKNIKLHLKQHEGPTKCEICGKLVVDMRNHLKMHIQRKATPKIACPTCGKMIAKGFSMREHINKVHLKVFQGKIYDCDQCDETFTRQNDFFK